MIEKLSDGAVGAITKDVSSNTVHTSTLTLTYRQKGNNTSISKNEAGLLSKCDLTTS